MSYRVIPEKILQYLPDWGPAGWMAVTLAGFVLVFTGVSLFHTPSSEVMYSHARLLLKESKSGGQLASYRLNVGNTGREPQRNVRLRFSREAMDHALLAPAAYNSGVIRLPAALMSDKTSMTMDLGPMDPGQRVEVTFLLSYKQGEAPPEWEAVFLGAEPEKGKAEKGDPAMTMVGRAWFAAVGWVCGI